MENPREAQNGSALITDRRRLSGLRVQKNAKCCNVALAHQTHSGQGMLRRYNKRSMLPKTVVQNVLLAGEITNRRILVLFGEERPCLK